MLKSCLLAATFLLASASAPAQGLKEETATVKLRISDEQVIKAITSNDVAGVEQLMAAGWDPAQPMKRGERRNSVGLLEPVLVYPLAEAFTHKAFDVARIIGARTAVENMDLVNSLGAPVWTSLNYAYLWPNWNAASAEQSAKATELARILLRSKTLRMSSGSSFITSLYSAWPIRGADRLSFYKEGLIKPADFEGGIGKAVLMLALKQYRLNAAISEPQAAEEIRQIVSRGVNPAELRHAEMFGAEGPMLSSCLRFDTSKQVTNNYCGYGETGAIDARAARLLIELGWKPSPKMMDTFWGERWLTRGKDILTVGTCGFRYSPALLVIPMTFEGNGFRRVGAGGSPEVDLMAVEGLRPGKAVVTKLQKALDKYQRGYEGKQECGGVCPPARETLCGGLLLALGGNLK